MTDIAALRAAYEAARDLARSTRTPEAMQASIEAWEALQAAAPQRKGNGATSRAGKRQYAEHCVRYNVRAR